MKDAEKDLGDGSAEMALDHLGDMLSILSDLSPDDRCQAHDKAEAFYNARRPQAQIAPTGIGYSRLVHKFPVLDADYDPDLAP